jgi:hypothetical protein
MREAIHCHWRDIIKEFGRRRQTLTRRIYEPYSAARSEMTPYAKWGKVINEANIEAE